MRVCIAVCAVLFPFFVNSASAESSSSEPTVYADVEESAVNAAVAESFDGPFGIFGLFLASQQHGASLEGKNTFTYNSMSFLGLAAGVGYSKSFKSNLLLGAEVLIDVSKKKKKQGTWESLNTEFEKANSTLTGAHTGNVEAGMFIPSLALKCGLAIPSYKSVLFAKVGLSRVTCKYRYYNEDQKFSDIDVAAMVPFLCLGVERKINKKWGAALEASLSLKKSVNKTQASVTHKVKVSRKDIKILATYNMSN